MLNRTRDVVKNKNKVERSRQALRKREMVTLRDTAAFKARLYDELKHVEIILSDLDVDAVKIEIPDKFINLFSTAIYSEDLAGYEVTQVPDKPNQFFIRRKFIAF